MELKGEYRIPAPRDTVWKALNDPDVLRQCIPGCQELEQTADDEFAAKVRAKVGPVNATFTGSVKLQDLDPPKGYTISGEGKGGAAGFAKGSAKVALEEDGGETVLSYTADAQVGGKMAQLGSRLIQGTAQKMADEFFSNFVEVVAPGAETAPEAGAAAPAETATEAASAEGGKASGGGLSPLVWAGGVAAVIVVLLLVFATS